MDTDNRAMVILNARSIAKRERNIGHPEVAAIIEDLASQLSGVVGERDVITVAMLKAAASATGCPVTGEVGPKNREFFTQIYRAMQIAALNNTGGQSDG